MSQDRLSPPPPECLCRLYSSNPERKGGTLIDELVVDRETHERRRCDPDGYRPEHCAHCGGGKLHVHDYPERKLRAEASGSGASTIVLVRYLCAECGATWRILPLFVARWLWRSWPVVESRTLGPPPAEAAPRVPERTIRRWRARLATTALLLLGVLHEGAAAVLAALTAALEPSVTRLELVVAHAAATGSPVGQSLSQLAALVHRLAAGVRLM